jgi:hypothetical protein
MKIKLLDNPKTELQHQTNIIKWTMIHREQYPDLKLLFHIPNGGTRDPIEARHLKDSGVKPGVPDLFLPVSVGRYHGLFIEVKSKNGKVSPEQSFWIDSLKKQNYKCEVAYGWEDAVRFLENYLRGE